jgi:type I restriction enzyme M protein
MNNNRGGLETRAMPSKLSTLVSKIPAIRNYDNAKIIDDFYHYMKENGELSSNTYNEGQIRRTIIEDDLVDCVIALPGKLFYSTTIPASLWFLSRNKKKQEPRDRKRESLFIDGRRMSVLIGRVHRELTDQEITLISKTYLTWRDDNGADTYQDISGFCRSVKSSEIAEHGYILTPGRYVGATEVEKDSEDFGVKMKHLVRELEQ